MNASVANSPPHGVFLCNKPKGFSSNRVLQRVKRAFGVKKAGHTGSLDPLATGVLPLCFGEATKFAQLGLEAVKCYRVVAKLGVETETGDSDGEICLELPQPPGLTENAVREVIQSFKGVQLQTPSQYSALKYQGKPLYEYARQGIVVPVPTRKICISSIEVEKIDLERRTFQLWVACSKGTYIRSLVQDIGKALGWCAHVADLHRTHAGLFSDSACERLDFNTDPLDISGECLPVSTLLLSVPWWFASGPEAKKLDNGHAVLRSACVEVGAMQSNFVKHIAGKGVQIQSVGLDQLMQDFYTTQQSKRSVDNIDETFELVALYTARPEVTLTPEGVCSLSPDEVSASLMLRGLVEKRSDLLKPRRMISPHCVIF